MNRITKTCVLVCCALAGVLTAEASGTETNGERSAEFCASRAAAIPNAGETSLIVVSPTILELGWVDEKAADPARLAHWDFVDAAGRAKLPSADEFVVKSGGRTDAIEQVGIRRRPLFAAQKRRDLRVGSYLYLRVRDPVLEGEHVEVLNPNGRLWSKQIQFTAKADAMRWSPAIHVNQEGYLPAFPKRAMVGYYLGSLGELAVAPDASFELIPRGATNVVFSGKLVPRPDRGYEYAVRPYQQVMEADFSDFKTPGEYCLRVPGLGVSFPFWIDDGIAADFTRAYALGLYHQRCGTSNGLPVSRFVRDPCHTKEAAVPNRTFTAVNQELSEMSGNFKDNPRHTAPQLKSVESSLYPFINTNGVDVRGGHHDAGDYSKYTINSASLIHVLTFAADAFPGAGELDNLGLPESGDGKSDLLQEAKWEADFLAKMQDADGGFYFLVYPRDREYEDNVSLQGSDCGDPQIVYPKTTAATAAAVAALAQMSSSPRFKKEFPDAAALYLKKARLGWEFLQRAIAKHGREGSYQKITHYGDEFMHDDELAWAATEMYLATGDTNIEKEIYRFDPSDPNTRRWTWWRMFECYGNAIRSYAFAARTARLTVKQLDSRFLEKCENEIVASAQDQMAWARDNAYGTSFPDASKRFRNAGWYFSMDRAFDLAVACVLDYPALNDPRPQYVDALLSNLNYEAGCNPVNVCYLTGMGWKRQHEIVHQFARNQRRLLPPTGIPLGNIQEGFAYFDPYKKELGALTFPSDGGEKNPYPFYDRWGDAFNTSTEFVVVNMGRSLGTAAFLMAQTPLKKQVWKSMEARINGLTNGAFRLEAEGVDLSQARCVWEWAGGQPVILRGNEPVVLSKVPDWMEAEAWLPDGRRVFGRWGR